MTELQHTPPPWRFELNEANRQLDLYGAGRMIVMDFERWGMQQATARFRDRGLMRPAVEFARIHPARAHHAKWFKLIDHPDARVIEQAPRLLAALCKLVACIDHPDEGGYHDRVDAMAEARAAIAAATLPDPTLLSP